MQIIELSTIGDDLENFVKHLKHFNLILVTDDELNSPTTLKQEEFMNELIQLDEVFEYETPESPSLYIALNSDIFGSESLNDYSIIEFLEELDDFCTPREEWSIEKCKLSLKYQRKLRYYCGRPENFPYILRWIHHNDFHPFSSEILDFIQKSLSNQASKTNNIFVKRARKLSKDLMLKKSKKKDNEESIREWVESDEFFQIPNLIKERVQDISNEQMKAEDDFTSKLFKYAFSEPTLFYYSVFALKNFLQFIYQTDELRKILMITKEKHNIYVTTYNY